MKIENTNGSIPQLGDYREDVDIRRLLLRYQVSAQLLQVMDEKKISRSDLAKLLGTSPSNISQILNGNRNLTLDTICDISMALESDVQINFKDTYEQKSYDHIVYEEEYTIEGSAEGLPYGGLSYGRLG
jgi:transcriptional regulator with XRE-family HTH domain